jgi:MFS superfamily sulfate permease-like transporter
VVAITALSELSLPVVLLWFGAFQIVWGLYYGAPISVEPMKALAALVLAGSISPPTFLLSGLLLGVTLLALGVTGTLGRLSEYIGAPVVRGIQLGVALVLLETGLSLGVGNPGLAALAVAVAAVVVVVGRFRLTAIVVLAVGALVAIAQGGLPGFAPPTGESLLLVAQADLSLGALEAAASQLAMTVGNAALAAAVLMAEYFDREVTPDQLSTSMGVMNLVGVPVGAIPMCHGSGGIAGKYAFGARTAGANVVLGAGYVVVALFGGGIVTAYPVSMLGVVLVLIGLQLARTSLQRAESLGLVVAIGLVGLLVNLGVAFVAGVVVTLAWDRLTPASS